MLIVLKNVGKYSEIKLEVKTGNITYMVWEETPLGSTKVHRTKNFKDIMQGSERSLFDTHIIEQLKENYPKVFKDLFDNFFLKEQRTLIFPVNSTIISNYSNTLKYVYIKKRCTYEELKNAISTSKGASVVFVDFSGGVIIDLKQEVKITSKIHVISESSLNKSIFDIKEEIDAN